MAKSRLPKKKETKEQFDERVKNSILKPGEEYKGYVIKPNETDTFDIFLNGEVPAGNFETLDIVKKFIDENYINKSINVEIPPPPSGSDQGPESGTAHRVGVQKRLLPCILTPEELHDRSIKLAEINGRIAAERAHQSVIKKELKDEMGTLEKEWFNLSNAVLTGVEDRTVDVAIEMLGDGETVEEIRQDTQERLGPPRPATDFEKQGQMFPSDGDMGFPEE